MLRLGREVQPRCTPQHAEEDDHPGRSAREIEVDVAEGDERLAADGHLRGARTMEVEVLCRQPEGT